MDWVRFLLIMSSLITVPVLWLLLRGVKAGDREGSYPDPSKKPLPTMETDDPTERGFTKPEMPVYGPVRSAGEYIRYLTMKYSWTMRDILFFRKFLKKKEKNKL